MSYNIGPVTVTPGTAVNNILRNSSAVIAIKLTNGTQFDLQFTGFGASGASTCPAGLEYMLHASDGNDGYINFMPIDSLNVGGQGVVNMVVYLQGDQLPKGQWPATVPAQRVIAAAFGGQVIATNLVNDGNTSQNIIESTIQGNSLGSNVKVLNTGEFILQEFSGATLTTLAHVIPNASPGTSDVLFGKLGNNTEIVGYLVADHDATFNGNITCGQVSQLGSVLLQSGTAFLQNIGTHNPAIDLTNHTGAIGLLLGTDKIASTLGHNVVLDTQQAADSISLMNNGALVLQILTSAINASQLLAPNAAAFSTVNGSVSGTCSLYTAVWGSGLKIGIYVMTNSYQTAVAQTLMFPSPILFGIIYSGTIGPATTVQFNNGGSAAAMRQWLTLGAINAAGTDSGCTNFHQLNMGQFGTSDRFIVNTTGGANINSFGFFIGQ